MNYRITSALLGIAFFVCRGLAPAQTPVAKAETPSAVADSTADKGKSGEAQFQTRNPRYKIGAGDSFDVSFELSPEFNQTVTVQPDGFITLRGVGDVHVAGQDVPQLTQTLKGAYSKILNDPQIVVVLKDFEKPYFIADGQIGHPGKYELRGDVTLTEAIAIAGGFQDSAKHSQVLLFRRVSNDWMEAKIVNVKKMYKDGKLVEDPHLNPGDMVVVPKNTLSKIQHFIPTYSMGAFTQFGHF
ncbi:MAG TPA: polysaccharide biosynthesis/export family protein [Dongiaceae bacterium]|nr:polysaccharide biosynthesis/export family protein [Dongiaceae bacterium]